MIPPKLRFLEKVGTLPKLLSAGMQYSGIKEIPGKQSNPVIMDMAKRIGVADIYTNDDKPWCAVFMFFLCVITGKPIPLIGSDRYNYLRAKTFITYGSPVDIQDGWLGDIVVIKRPDGNHVGILIAYTKEGTIWIFGGNQSNSVGFMEVDIDRVIAIRRFYATAPPESVQKYIIDSAGVLSTDEA